MATIVHIVRATTISLVMVLAADVRAVHAQVPITRDTRRDTTRAGGIDTMKITAHYDNGIGTSNAASAGHVTPQLIDDRPLLRPGEVMEYVPGMIVTQHSGGGKANQYFLRGFNLDHGTDFETTLDGMPVNMPSHAHGQGYTDLNFMIPELIGGVDYFKGPYYAAQSDFATAGSANMHYVDGAMQSRAEVTGGSNEYGRALITGSPQIGSHGGHLVYGVEGDHIDGPWVHPDDYRKLIGVLRYAQPIDGGRWSITAMSYNGRWSATDQIPERAYDSGLISRFGTIDSSDGGNSHRYSLSGNVQRSLFGGELATTAYGIRYYLDLYSDFTFFLNDPVHGDQINQHDDRDVLGWNGSWTKPLELLGKQTTNTIGWDIRHDRVAPSGLYHTEDRVRLSTTLEDRVGETASGLYFENQTQWSGWLRSIAGIRVEQYNYDVASNLAANSGSGSASIGLPKLSLVFGPWAQTEFFANAGEGFHSNDVRGAAEHVDPSTGDPTEPVTPLVRGIGAEIGARTERIRNLQSSLSLWSLHLGSELVFSGDDGTTEAGRPSERIGVEWSNHYTPRRWLLMDLDLAETRARFTDDDPVGRYIPEALNTTASAGITLEQTGPWTTSLFMRYFGPRALIESDSVCSPSTTLFNAQVSYRLSSRVGLRGDVFNIFDAEDPDITYFYTSRLPGEPTSGVADLHFHPVERRSLRFGLSVLF